MHLLTNTEPIPDKSIFCSSPWLHARLGHNGKFSVCRWADRTVPGWETLAPEQNVQALTFSEYFNSSSMIEIRNQLLNGIKPSACAACYYQDEYGKLSGRKKQLFRSKLDDEGTFDTAFADSPHYPLFKFSQENNGRTNALPIDLQIDLETTCNSSCIMCRPSLSSRVHADYIKLHKISPTEFSKPDTNLNHWSSDPKLVKRIVDDLVQIPNINYIHFIGGETLFVESFFTICEALINANLAKDIIVGTTTNGTIYSSRLEKIIPEFRAFHLGLSIESVNPLNDYIRYPSKIDGVLSIFNKFLLLRKHTPSLHLQLRITPTVFSILYLDEVVQYMIDNNVTAESCNILNNPSVLRVELLPTELRQLAIQKLSLVMEKNNIPRFDNQTPDTRNPEFLQQVLSNVAFGYIDFLTNMQAPVDVEAERSKLVKFITSFETLRNNSIIDYAPEFSDFLKEYGYVLK